MKFATVIIALMLGIAMPAQVCTAQTFSSVAEFVASGGEGTDSNPFDFDILLAAAVKADLVGALADPDANLTLFAPNDLAFILLARDLGFRGFDEAGALSFLDSNVPGDLLASILLYHVVGESLTAIDVLLDGITRQPIETLNGTPIRPRLFTLVDGDPNDANPTLFFPLDVSTGNGIVHTVSRVLRPIDL